MNRYILCIMVGLLSLSCNGQKDDVNKEKNDSVKNLVKEPNGSWKVNKEFDEHGNLIRYDSIYSWSSGNQFSNLSAPQRDSLMQALKSRFFMDFSVFENQGFDDIFTEDSLFSKRYFNNGFFESDFGSDLMDIDKIRQRMLARQKEFLERYQSEFRKNKDEN